MVSIMAILGSPKKSAMVFMVGLLLNIFDAKAERPIIKTGNSEEMILLPIPGSSSAVNSTTVNEITELDRMFFKVRAKIGPAITMAGIAITIPYKNVLVKSE